MSLATNFTELFSTKPEIICEAPGRVNLIGEHVDYCDGFVMPFAISDRTYAAVSRRQDRHIRISSMQRRNEIFETTLDDLKPGLDGKWERYICGVIWAFGNQITNGLDILVDGRVALGAGLSSSAALECSVALALNELFKSKYTLPELARLAQRAENEYVGMPCGIMDQSVSLMAQSGNALLLDCRDLSTEQIPIDLAGAGLELLIVDTRAHHALVDGGYAERRASCESAANKLGIKALRDCSIAQLETSRSKLTELEYMRAEHVVRDIERVHECVVLLKQSDFSAVGQILTQSHASLRDLFEISCPELNLAVDTALANNSLGGRMIGGGFGGSAIALFKVADISSAKEAIAKAFTGAGFNEPRFFTSLPSSGARITQQL
ncbi:galactokinase [Actinobacteria bacterium IMCC26103]|nr:galactokinase [Actinobacteria bacterium IMCC26103]